MRCRLIFILFFSIISALFSLSIEADSTDHRTVAEIKADCSNPIGKLFCLGFIKGVLETSVMIEPQYIHSKICEMKAGTSGDQGIRIVLGYIESHPEL